MIKPRQSLVVVKLIEQREKQIGKIVVPTDQELYCEAEVFAVGPGTVAAEGGISETADLKIGQRVFLKHKVWTNGPMGKVAAISGIEYRDGDDKYHIFEQGNVLGILAEPV